MKQNYEKLGKLICFRFAISGVCDAAYITNSLEYDAENGKTAKEQAEYLQFAYNSIIQEDEIDELESIIRTGTLDFSKCEKGLIRYKQRVIQQIVLSDELRKGYLRTVLNSIMKNLEMLNSIRHRKTGILLAKGDGNWDYYLKTSVEKIQQGVCPTNTKDVLVNAVYSIPNVKAAADGCKSCYFGDLNHFKKTYYQSHFTLTELGEKVVFENYVPN